MEKENDTTLLQRLLSSTPQNLLEWLDEGLLSTDAFDLNFLLGLAQGASANAVSRLTEDSREQEDLWAKAAVKIYRYLANASPEHKDSFLDSEMMVRVQMINKYLPEDNDPIRDPKDIYDYFFRGLPFSFDETKELSDRWQVALKEHSNPFESLNKADILELRKIKNRLKVVEQLEGPMFPFRDNWMLWYPISRWLELKAVLP